MANRVLGWKVTVGDSMTETRVISSREMRWADLPSRIITIMLYLPDGYRRILGNRDFYWFDGDGSLDTDWHNSFTAPADRGIVVKDGFLLETAVYERAQADTMTDRVAP